VLIVLILMSVSYYSLYWDIAPLRELLSFFVFVFDGLYRYKRFFGTHFTFFLPRCSSDTGLSAAECQQTAKQKPQATAI